MIAIIPFKAEHLLNMPINQFQGHERVSFAPAHLAELEKIDSFTVTVSDVPMACFGWIKVYADRVQLWTVFSESAGEHMVSFTRIGRDLVECLPYRRIDAEVEVGYELGERWATLVGLEKETSTPLKAYNAHGHDVHIYARVK